MIQDIAPHRYDNTYRRQKPEPEDFLLCILRGRVLLREEKDTLQIPLLREILLAFPAAADGGRAVYLFAIDEKPYFLLELEEGEEIDWSKLPPQAESEAAPAAGAGSESQIKPAAATGSESEVKPAATADSESQVKPSAAAGSESEVKPSAAETLSPWGFKTSQDIRSMEPMYQAFAAITALQLGRWRASRRFCGRCGARTQDSETERALVCPVCGQTEYPKISPAVIVAVTDGDRLLMSRYRTSHSTYRGYALIAGFVEIGETFEETVRREVMEEVGLRIRNIRYFKSQPWAFTDTEMIGFFAELDGSDAIRLQEDELSEAGWYRREEIPDDDRLISVGTEMKMFFKYGEDWERKLAEKKGAGETLL